MDMDKGFAIGAIRLCSLGADEPAQDRAIGPLPLDEAPLLPLRTALQETSRFAHVRVVRDYPVLMRIGTLRHQQYVANQRKTYASAVLTPDCLIEQSDFTSTNIYARDAEGITCAMRVGDILDDCNPYASVFERVARDFRLSLARTLTCTRLVRAPRHSGRHAVDLIRFVRWQTVNAGWRYCIMQTAERLVPFFRKFEFYETGVWLHDAAAGRLQILILDTKLKPIQEKESPHGQ